MTLPNINVYSVPENVLLSRQNFVQPTLTEPKNAMLEQLPPRELSEQELRSLIEAAPLKTRQLIGLFLSGVDLAEASHLVADHFNLELRQLIVPPPNSRALPLSPSVCALFSGVKPIPSWHRQDGVDEEDLNALISCAAFDSGLPDPASITGETLRHSYILYLVKQGIRLGDLEQITGPLPAKLLASYGQFSPSGPGLRPEAIQLTHPALRRNDTPA
jgi:integrase